jgi:hypothetical protein
MVRFLMVLAAAAVVVAVFWPYLRKLELVRTGAAAAPSRKRAPYFLAIVITLVLSFVFSTALWLFGR